ncbi:MAG: hypothetical protein ACPGUD_03380 [Parashewanella sp.]
MLKILFTTSLLLCSLSVAALALNVEELRLSKAQTDIPNIASRYDGLVSIFKQKIKTATNEQQITQATATIGNRLWQQAVRDVQAGHFDDRPLYWSRLALRKLAKDDNDTKLQLANWQRQILTRSIETTSRGINDLHFSPKTDIKILLTGFDPFFLDKNIAQSNPSGLAALALDGFKFKVGKKTAQIQTVMIPVRFVDFDQGMIEGILTPMFRARSIDAVFTVSMGRTDFDLEHFPAKNRSAVAPDNLNIYTKASKQSPKAPRLRGKTLNGAEFIEFTLPVKAMQSINGKWKVNDNKQVSTLQQGKFKAKTLADLKNQTSVTGSGGGYLSNEISYRSIRLMKQFNLTIPNGHIHTPKIKGYDAATEAEIVAQIQAMVVAAMKALEF